MKNLKTHAPMTVNEKFIAWLQLTRFDKPVGTELLLHPTLWALFLAYASKNALPNFWHIVIFALAGYHQKRQYSLLLAYHYWRRACCFFYPNQFFIGLWVRYYWHLFTPL